jgi:hypothetical protein
LHGKRTQQERNMKTRALIVAACFAIGGCTTMTDFGTSLRKESMRDEQGHVIGYKQLFRNEQTGEILAQVSLYTPMYGAGGEIVAYEEQAKGGSIIRDLDGHSIGGRFSDLRSRGTNTKSKGLMIVMRPADADQVALSKPKFPELLASLQGYFLRRIQ